MICLVLASNLFVFSGEPSLPSFIEMRLIILISDWKILKKLDGDMALIRKIAQRSPHLSVKCEALMQKCQYEQKEFRKEIIKNAVGLIKDIDTAVKIMGYGKIERKR